MKKNNDPNTTLEANAASFGVVIPRSEHCISTLDISKNALLVLKRLHHANYEAYLVGGSVRDLLLRHAPKDFDIATNAHPHEIKKLFRNCRLIGRRFQLAHIYFDREIIEVATFRGTTDDETNTHRRVSESGIILRDNVFGEIHQDAWRRDFTINALYYNIADKSVVDFTQGAEDLKEGLVKLIGDPTTRYQEDPVRMLRAVRFAAKLNFKIEDKTNEPIKKLAPLLALISPSRLFEEVIKLYQSGYATEVHQKLCELNLFPYLFTKTAELLQQKHEWSIKLITSTLANTDARIKEQKPVTPAFLLAAMLWHPLQDNVTAIKAEHDVPAAEAIDRAIEVTLRTQIKSVSIPRRLTEVMREIWVLQYRLAHLQGKRPLRLLHHPRFRASYDLLLLRTQSGELDDQLATWWTNFQHASEEEQTVMLSKLKKTTKKKVKKPKVTE